MACFGVMRSLFALLLDGKMCGNGTDQLWRYYTALPDEKHEASISE